MKSKVRCALGVALSILLLVPAAHSAKKSNRVAVNAQASPMYILERATDPAKKVQSYHVIKGKYFPGNTSDGSMNDVSFMDIAQNLAANLRRQNYLSEPDPGKGDLLIMINWGATDYDPDFMEVAGFDSIDDFGFGDANAEELEEIASHASTADLDPSRVAMLVSQDLSFGVSRMYEAYRKSSMTDVKVFREEAEAIEWLLE